MAKLLHDERLLVQADLFHLAAPSHRTLMVLHDTLALGRSVRVCERESVCVCMCVCVCVTYIYTYVYARVKCDTYLYTV
jgi:hypothetical protein